MASIGSSLDQSEDVGRVNFTPGNTSGSDGPKSQLLFMRSIKDNPSTIKACEYALKTIGEGDFKTYLPFGDMKSETLGDAIEVETANYSHDIRRDERGPQSLSALNILEQNNIISQLSSGIRTMEVEVLSLRVGNIPGTLSITISALNSQKIES